MMDERLQDALRYLSVPAGSFWQWTDDGRVVAWSHGATVAFREEIALVLEYLKPRGLPPLDAVLLLIAATRAYWKNDSENLRSRLSSAVTHSGSKIDADLVAGNVFGMLDRVHQFSTELIHPMKAKAELATVVFESATSVTTAETARLVCEILTSGMVSEHNQIPSLPRLRGGRLQTTGSLIRDAWILATGLRGLTEDSLRFRLRTGLEEEPVPAEIEIPAEPAAVQLMLQKLALDDELSGLCRVARNLSAVLQLPRAITDSEELPLGGVSDIANRGSLDRLLLSELAHDDLMLATRVALNEALYLRREAPPGQPPQRRYVLLDSGLRMWGVPRVFAAATLLSIAAIGAAGSSLLAYRASGGRIVPIDPTSRDGLLALLEVLEAEAHPGMALEGFFQRVAEDDLPGDAILITCDEALSDPGFQRAVADADAPPCYVATVARTGDFKLWSRTICGMKCLTSLTLNLDELLNQTVHRKRALVDTSVDPNLPAIFRATKFPFRLPQMLAKSGNKETAWSVRLPLEVESPPASQLQPVLVASDTMPPSPTKPAKYGVMVLCRDRRLLYFDQDQRGGVQIADGVPFGGVLWSCGRHFSNFSCALIHRPCEPAYYLVTVNVALKSLVSIQKLASEYLANSGPGGIIRGVASHGDVLFVIYQTVIEAFDLQEGGLLYQGNIDPRWQWRRDRFFWDISAPKNEKLLAISFDGTTLKSELVHLSDTEYARDYCALFDREGHDGPFGFHSKGAIINFSDHTASTWLGPHSNPKVLEVGDDGNRLLIANTEANKPCRRVIQLDSVAVSGPTYVESLAQWDVKRIGTGWNLMHRFSRALLGADGSLSLVSKSGARWRFVTEGKVLRLQQAPIQANPLTELQGVMLGATHRVSVSFEQARHPCPGCGLTVATWKDGSRIWIDSRGLLHLQSSDQTIPEATFVLCDVSTAVWTSDGRIYGSNYYVDAKEYSEITPAEIFKEILIPFTARLK